MRVTGDIVAFLEARLAEREVLAREADWNPARSLWRAEFPLGRTGGKGIVWNGQGQSVLSNPHEPTCEHVVAWQPAHVLDQIAAQRRIIDRYTALSGPMAGLTQVGTYMALGEVLIDLAYPYRDHPDWDDEWEVEDKTDAGN